MPSNLKNKGIIWIHAASVGEVRGISPLINKIFDYKDEVLITTTSKTGRNEARKLFKNAIVFLAPLDLPFLVRRFIKQHKPSLLIINETEIWPSTISQAKKFNIPVVIVNGRISDRSYPRYKFFKFYFSRIIKKIDLIITQTELDRERFLSLGANIENTLVAGSTKFDQLGSDIDMSRFELLRRRLVSENDFIITLGSVREEEEEIVLEAIKRILLNRDEKTKNENIKFLVVPRHPERFNIFYEKVKNLNLLVSKFSNISGNDNFIDFQVLIVDKMGELLYFYKLADLCFVGGTFSKVGGHNISEPLLFSKPLIIGPEIHSQKEAFNIINSNDSLIQVSNVNELVSQVFYLLKNKNILQKISKNSDNAMQSLRGGTDRIFEIIKRYL